MVYDVHKRTDSQIARPLVIFKSSKMMNGSGDVRPLYLAVQLLDEANTPFRNFCAEQNAAYPYPRKQSQAEAGTAQDLMLLQRFRGLSPSRKKVFLRLLNGFVKDA